ncbi:hypothetical protein [Actinoplanes xinjiangensis]|jgi:hypothetical protein|uniref:Lipoprotein n=1 Tax=Actinoplanes xinjiangensis TaxID=512350 RepID=A0A316FFS9_9ACTN|nr:hypothetical protein [Actinoplanes xinjiangensis]PWK46566.1 hypothetical protein BC793_109134 [Actinoplanes xinjiangensis]GIF40611.1 hypothetical protein Axi01nite_49220 [Actinoplanes xinjiangensis]
MRLPSALPVALLTAVLAGCGVSDATPEPAPGPPSASPSAAAPAPEARNEFAGLAALALDRRYAALYTLESDGSSREIVAAVADDGTWRVDIPGGALGGTAGVTVIRVPAGLYQCTLSTPSAPVSPTCVRVAERGDKVPRRYDPRVQRLFRQWLPVFIDRKAPLAVSAVQPLAGVEGSCYAVDSVTAALDRPVDVGIYCYSADGMLTGARVDFGLLKLVRQVAGPKSLQLPGPEVAGEPMGLTAPPPAPVPSLVAPS